LGRQTGYEHIHADLLGATFPTVRRRYACARCLDDERDYINADEDLRDLRWRNTKELLVVIGEDGEDKAT
jgi:hypothetical protein